MNKIFIAYSDETCAYSLKRIGRQARKLRLFDEVHLYGPDDLPDYLKASPLMKYKRGGGYWSWKPVLIHEELQKHDDGDVVVYVDAGCTLNKSTEWNMMFKLMQEYDTICFHYDAEMPVWEKFGNTSTQIKYWTKQSALDFLDDYCQDDTYREALKIWGGLLFVKGKNNDFLRKWLDITLNHPEVIMDASEEELKRQPAGFAFHKHDQSVITALAYNDKNTLVLPEVSETNGEKAFVWASRIRANNWRTYTFHQSKYYLRKIIGDKLFDACKSKVIS